MHCLTLCLPAHFHLSHPPRPALRAAALLAGAGAALYAFGRGTGEVLVHERSALGAGGDLTLVDGTDLLAVSSSSRRDYGAGGLLVVRTDGTGLRRLDVGHGIVGSYRGAVITMSERDRDCRPLSDDVSDDVVVTGVTEG